MKHEKELTALNRAKLYDEGRDSENRRLRPPYAASTVASKKRRGKPYDRVTLRESGMFQDRIRILAGREQVEFTRNNIELRRGFELVSFLRKRYGKDIFGLTKKDVDRMRDIILPDVISGVRKLLPKE